MEDLIVVIRSIGERTTFACEELVSSIFPNSQIYTTNVRPFSKAIYTSFKIGLDSKADWLLNIDADVLIHSEGILNLVRRGIETPEHVFQIQGVVLDKFIPTFRPAGNHLYRLAHAKKAIKFIPKDGRTLRPETHMLNTMRNYGFPWKQTDIIVGIHDFEQFYEDIFRKSVLHAQKHQHINNILSTYWTKQAQTDPDFCIALAGMREGRKLNKTVKIDKSFLLQEARESVKLLGLEEKLPDVEIATEDIRDRIHAHTIKNPEFSSSLQDRIFPLDMRNRLHVTRKNKVRHRIRRAIYRYM